MTRTASIKQERLGFKGGIYVSNCAVTRPHEYTKLNPRCFDMVTIGILEHLLTICMSLYLGIVCR